MILSITAYSKWKANADDYNQVLDNWKTSPVINISLVATTDSCPTDWEQIHFGDFTYQRAACERGNQTLEYFCDTTYPYTGTDLFETIGTFKLSNWENSKMCVLRSGVNAIDRPIEAESGFKSCGTNPQTGEYFFNDNLPCPLVYIGTQVPSSGTYETISFGNGINLHLQRDAAYGRPYLQWATGEGRPCKKNWRESFNGVRTTGNQKGANMTGQSVDVYRYYAANALNRNPFQTIHPSIGDCANSDYRFVEIDSQYEQGLYDTNQLSNSGPIPGYAYVYANDSSSTNWTQWNRPEILWKEDCEYTRSDVDNVNAVIKVVTATTLAVMVISIFAAIFDCVLEGWAFKNLHDDDDTNDEVAGTWQKLGNCCCTIGLMVTTIVTFIFISKAKNFFRAMKDAECSDFQTNDSIGYLAETAIGLFNIWIGKIVLDSIKLCYYFYVMWKGRAAFFGGGKSSL